MVFEGFRILLRAVWSNIRKDISFLFWFFLVRSFFLLLLLFLKCLQCTTGSPKSKNYFVLIIKQHFFLTLESFNNEFKKSLNIWIKPESCQIFKLKVSLFWGNIFYSCGLPVSSSRPAHAQLIGPKERKAACFLLKTKDFSPKNLFKKWRWAKKLSPQGWYK